MSAIAYVWQGFRHRDLQFPANFLQFVKIDAPVHHGVTVGADPDKVSQGRRYGLVVSHIASRIPG